MDTPCREWQGLRSKKGYGRVTRDGKHWRLHRYVWTLVNGPIPEGMQVCHHCDNPPCFRLDHLFLGTNRLNVDDKMAKGRTYQITHQTSKTHCPQGHPYEGENLVLDTNWNGRPCRRCRTCRNEKRRAMRRQNKEN